MEKNQYIVKTLFGLEEVLFEELKSIGIQDLKLLNRAVEVQGTLEQLYTCNLALRTAIRILSPITSFSAKSMNHLYQKVREIPWNQYFTTDQTFAVNAVTHGIIFTHSHAVSLKTKDAIVDCFRDVYGIRPDVQTHNPDIRIHIHIAERRCSISIDSSGSPLYMRGYKTEQMSATMNEVLAAGIIQLSEWDKKQPLYDPMCGSGTLPIEAALLAADIPPGLNRRFAFQNWQNYDEKLWTKVQKACEPKTPTAMPDIYASDKNPKNVNLAKRNARRAGVKEFIQFDILNFTKSPAKELQNAIMIMNPPYGERLKKHDDIIALYKEIGDRFKESFTGNTAYVFSGNLQALKNLGLKPSKKITLYNGKLECKLQKYELYKGSKKAKHQQINGNEKQETRN